MINLTATHRAGGSLAGVRHDYTIPKPRSANVTCSKNNTAVIMVDAGQTAIKQNYVGITIFTVLLLGFTLVVVCIMFVSMKDEQPDDQNDDMNSLLYAAPEMVLAPENIIDDEPWEAGGDDY